MEKIKIFSLPRLKAIGTSALSNNTLSISKFLSMSADL